MFACRALRNSAYAYSEVRERRAGLARADPDPTGKYRKASNPRNFATLPPIPLTREVQIFQEVLSSPGFDERPIP